MDDSQQPHLYPVASRSPPVADGEGRRARGRRGSLKSNRVSKSDAESATVLACNHCRSKKVKCIIEAENCQRCNRLGVRCIWPDGDQRKCPSSKSHTRELYQRIAYLEAALEAANTNQTNAVRSEARRASTSALSIRSIPSGDSDNLISRLCGRQWKLNSDEDGQYKFFGPTSSLHLTESVSSTLFGSYGLNSMGTDMTLNGRIDPEMQTHLLSIFFKFQHTQVFDRKEFLEGMQAGQSKYFSKALLCTVYACAARISERPEVRAMVIPSPDALDDEQPFLLATATKLVDQELQKPQITTIQALLLLSVVQCAFSNDTKGWLLVGNACRLAIDLGLHRNAEQLTSINLTPRDITVRRMTWLGCLAFDRLWALYLGRPFCLQNETVEPEMQISAYELPWDMRIAVSWACLLVTVGSICEALNGEKCTTETLDDLDAQLQEWYQQLGPELQYYGAAHASILLLHMQYYSSKIILHRPTANFGSTPSSQATHPPGPSQQICLENAKSIATVLEDYRRAYGSAATLSGVGLHIIATASTILIAGIAEKRTGDTTDLVLALKTCVRSLSEMEKTYIVARRVRRVIRLVMGLCHLDIDSMDTQADTTPLLTNGGMVDMDIPSVGSGSDLTAGGPEAFDFPTDGINLANMYQFLWSGNSPQASSQFDIMYSLDF